MRRARLEARSRQSGACRASRSEKSATFAAFARTDGHVAGIRLFPLILLSRNAIEEEITLSFRSRRARDETNLSGDALAREIMRIIRDASLKVRIRAEYPRRQNENSGRNFVRGEVDTRLRISLLFQRIPQEFTRLSCKGRDQV